MEIIKFGFAASCEVKMSKLEQDFDRNIKFTVCEGSIATQSLLIFKIQEYV